MRSPAGGHPQKTPPGQSGRSWTLRQQHWGFTGPSCGVGLVPAQKTD